MNLSEEISYALRHAPWEYELEMDENGWVSVEQLLNALRENSKWENVTEEDLNYIMIRASVRIVKGALFNGWKSHLRRRSRTSSSKSWTLFSNEWS